MTRGLFPPGLASGRSPLCNCLTSSYIFPNSCGCMSGIGLLLSLWRLWSRSSPRAMSLSASAAFATRSGSNSSPNSSLRTGPCPSLILTSGLSHFPRLSSSSFWTLTFSYSYFGAVAFPHVIIIYVEPTVYLIHLPSSTTVHFNILLTSVSLLSSLQHASYLSIIHIVCV